MQNMLIFNWLYENPEVQMRSLYLGAIWLILTGFVMGALVPGKTAAADRATLWCTTALQTLAQQPAGSEAQWAERLRAMNPAPAVEESPQRLVYVSSRARQTGNGTAARPYQQLQVAVNKARPGDKIIVGPGEYTPVRIEISGTPTAPIILSGQADDTGRAMIDGSGTKVRGLIEVRGASYVTISGFRLQNAPRDGVFIEGTDEGERGIRILGNDIDTTGNSGIFVAGIVMRFITEVDEYRLFDVLVEGNRITNTNTPKGVNEAISLGGGVDGFIIRNNHVFDTRQYGIDAKAGAINGEITDNVIHGIERHGIYLDTGSRRVAHIDVRRNAVFGVRNGIVLARESNRDPEHPNLHDIVVADNLVFDSDEFGIKAYRHPDDSGVGRFDSVQISGNCLCGIRRDAIRLGGIGDFARDIRAEDNLILSSGGTVWNKIGAFEQNNGDLHPDLQCP